MSAPWFPQAAASDLSSVILPWAAGKRKGKKTRAFCRNFSAGTGRKGGSCGETSDGRLRAGARSKQAAWLSRPRIALTACQAAWKIEQES
jgi:hypothetical protein